MHISEPKIKKPINDDPNNQPQKRDAKILVWSVFEQVIKLFVHDLNVTSAAWLIAYSLPTKIMLATDRKNTKSIKMQIESS